ncbi:MAG: ribonuclease D [Rudaea sp.]
MIRPDPVLVADAESFARMTEHLLSQPIVAVDSESDSLYSYFEKLCLLQFSVPGVDYILDTLAVRALDPLGELFARPDIQKVFHAAEYDIMVIKRDFKLEFANIFDTMAAARILGWKQVGLGNILRDRFGVKLDKRFQRADWGKRPLSPEEIAYARNDTHYLIELRNAQQNELERKGRLHEAAEEFERLTHVEWAGHEFDPNRYYTIEGARRLGPVELGILRELYRFREETARQADRPPFKIMSESTLFGLARSQPASLPQLGAIHGVGDWLIRRYGKGVLEAIERGRAHPQRTVPRLANRNGGRVPDVETRERYARLKEWRRQRALERGVESDVIVSNDLLMLLARRNPHTSEELAGISGLGAWKAREYGEEILNILRHGQ